MTSEALRGPSRAAIVDALLLRGPERTAAACPPAVRERVRQLAFAARTRARAADLLVEGNAASAIVLYRESALLYIAAFTAASTGEDVREPLALEDLLARFAGLPKPPPPGGLERFLDELNGADRLAVDRLDVGQAAERGEAARALVAWLGRLVEPRTVEEIRFARAGRLGALAVAGVLVAAWIVAGAVARRNIALHKPVSVSAVHPTATSPPSGLTDGVKSGSYGVHTANAADPWVQVDLQRVYFVDTVKVYNRGDGWFDDGLPMTMQLSEDGARFMDVGTRTTSFSQTTPWVVKPGHRAARYIRVRGARDRYVTLSELEAFGDPK